jgi:hypothetical protein
MNGMGAPSRARGFDAAAYQDGFRAACARRGIDPVSGSSVYQAANIRAEQQKAAARQALCAAVQRDGGAWWQTPELWLDETPCRSTVEEGAFARLFRAALIAALFQMRLEVARAYA